MVVRSHARKTKRNWNDGNGVYSINYDNLLDAAAIYFTRFERYIVHHILLSNHVLTRHVVFLLYWSRYGGNLAKILQKSVDGILSFVLDVRNIFRL